MEVLNMKSIKKLILAALLSLMFVGTASATVTDIKILNCGANQSELQITVDSTGWYYILVTIGSGDTGWRYITSLSAKKITLYGTSTNTAAVITEYWTGDTLVGHCSYWLKNSRLIIYLF